MGRSRRSGKIRQLRAIRLLRESQPISLPPRYYDKLLTEFDRLVSTPNESSKSNDIEITYVRLRRRKPSTVKIETPRPPLKIRIVRRNPPSSPQEPFPTSPLSSPLETFTKSPLSPSLCYPSYFSVSPPSSPYSYASYYPIPSPELDPLSARSPSPAESSVEFIGELSVLVSATELKFLFPCLSEHSAQYLRLYIYLFIYVYRVTDITHAHTTSSNCKNKQSLLRKLFPCRIMPCQNKML